MQESFLEGYVLAFVPYSSFMINFRIIFKFFVFNHHSVYVFPCLTLRLFLTKNFIWAHFSFINLLLLSLFDSAMYTINIEWLQFFIWHISSFKNVPLNELVMSYFFILLFFIFLFCVFVATFDH